MSGLPDTSLMVRYPTGEPSDLATPAAPIIDG
jgi:hypothetical protein